MDPLKSWLRSVHATYTKLPLIITDNTCNPPRQINIGSRVTYRIVPVEDYALPDLKLVDGKATEICRKNMSYLFQEYIAELNLEIFYVELNRSWCQNKCFQDENLCKMIDEIHAEEQLDDLSKVDQVRKLPDELFKEVFYNSLLSCKAIPNVEKLLDCMYLDEQVKLDEIRQEAERQYQEQLWRLLLPEIPARAITAFINKSGGSELPKNFVERMKLSPLIGMNYVQSQRHSTDQQFGSK